MPLEFIRERIVCSASSTTLATQDAKRGPDAALNRKVTNEIRSSHMKRRQVSERQQHVMTVANCELHHT